MPPSDLIGSAQEQRIFWNNNKVYGTMATRDIGGSSASKEGGG